VLIFNFLIFFYIFSFVLSLSIVLIVSTYIFMYFIGVSGLRVLPLLINGWMDNVFSNHVDFTFSDIVKMITHIKSSNTADPQGFSNSFLRRLKFALAKPLSALYTHIFTSGKIPSDWRLANVTPVFKKRCIIKRRQLSSYFSNVNFQ